MPQPRTITDAARFIQRGELTPHELLDQCLANIDRHEAWVRAWVLVDRTGAREQAERLTHELKHGQYRGPLHGIPIGIKDIIDVFDLPTGCGSKLWANSIARRDAACVERLRQAGAIILGKTVTTAYASFDPPPTRNPWNHTLTPGGSSSGSAAAVACGMCLGALATQTGGSITRPASYCGVCSLKPTFGRVSVEGVLPLAPSLDHVGVMANSVRDLALLFHTIAGFDPRDSATPAQPVLGSWSDRPAPHHDSNECPETLQLCTTDDFFLPRCDSAMQTCFDSALLRLTAREHAKNPLSRVQSIALPAAFAEVTERHHLIMAAEAAAYHETRFRTHPHDYPAKVSSLIEHGLRSSAAEYARCKQHQKQLTEQLQTSFHVLAVPATPTAAPPADTTGNPVLNSPWSYAGMPVISLPIGWSPNGLPLSLQLIAKLSHEEDLFRVATACEHAIAFESQEVPL